MSEINLVELPPELLAKIFLLLTDSDISHVCLCCSAFHDAFQIELIWQIKCQRVIKDKAVTLPEGWTYQQLYSKLLFPYGHLLGTWQPQYQCYGGLAKVEFVENRLLCHEYQAPAEPHIDRSMSCQPVFSVEISSRTEPASIKCHRGYRGPHEAVLKKKELTEFSILCCDREAHMHPEGEGMHLEEFVFNHFDPDSEEHFPVLMAMELLMEKYHTLTKIRDKEIVFKRLDLKLGYTGNLIIKPGLFKGTYGSHGIEIVRLEFDEEENKMVATKVTGDPNVPANKVSVCADLSRPMVLTADQQTSLRMLQDIDLPDLEPGTDPSQLPAQPFVIPTDCYPVRMNATSHCKARFYGQGQIAGHGFQDPSYTASHFVVFDEDTFGQLWLALSCVSLYKRVTEYDFT